jgi:hypothetical protein
VIKFSKNSLPTAPLRLAARLSLKGNGWEAPASSKASAVNSKFVSVISCSDEEIAIALHGRPAGRHHPTAGTVIDHLDRRGLLSIPLHPFPAARTNRAHLVDASLIVAAEMRQTRTLARLFDHLVGASEQPHVSQMPSNWRMYSPALGSVRYMSPLRSTQQSQD